jgi:hypothetical protein
LLGQLSVGAHLADAVGAQEHPQRDDPALDRAPVRKRTIERPCFGGVHPLLSRCRAALERLQHGRHDGDLRVALD